MQSRRVSASKAGMGSCQSAHSLMISALSAAVSLEKPRAASSEHGKDSCHMANFEVNGMA